MMSQYQPNKYQPDTKKQSAVCKTQSAPVAEVPRASAQQEKDGWYGIGTFGKVGPCTSLRQAMIRSGI